MKHAVYPWCIALPLVLISSLALIGADATGPAADKADSDSDGMPDIFEQRYGLAYLDSRDALLDGDDDCLVNVREALLGGDPYFQDSDFDGVTDDKDESPASRFYIQWGAPWYTANEEYVYPRPAFVLESWKNGGEWFSNYRKPETGRVVRKAGELSLQSGWYADSVESNAAESLCVALDRDILTNNLVYAIHYWNRDNAKASLYLDLLGTNDVVVAADLYGNLMDGTNEESVVLLDVPTGYFPDASVIQLRRGSGEVVVFEGLLYIDEDGDGLDHDFERQNGTSDYNTDSDGDGIGDYEACFHKTNNIVPVEPVDFKPNHDNDDQGNSTGIIYVDQARGSDSNTGRAPSVSAKHGPKKTVGKGLVAVDADRAHTLVIKSGTYNENLDISGKNIRVVIEGKVKL